MALRSISSLLVAAVLATVPAAAQNAPATPATPATSPSVQSPLQSAITRETFEDLPNGGNVMSLLETFQPEVISNRFFTGGLNTGVPGRLGAFLTSPSQTEFRIGDISIADPEGSGAPLLFPELLWWRQIGVDSGAGSAGARSPGLLVDLFPQRPSERWTRAFEVGGAPAPWVTSVGSVPAISRLESWTNGSALISGPLGYGRAGIVAGASWTRNSQFQRGATSAVGADVESVFANLVVPTTSRGEWSGIAWVQRASYPLGANQSTIDRLPGSGARDATVHLQGSWSRHTATAAGLRVFAGFTQRNRSPFDAGTDAAPVLERLIDDPVPQVIDIGDRTTRRLTVGGRWTAPSRTLAGHRHTFSAGFDLERATSRIESAVVPIVGELVDGRPARVWRYESSGIESARAKTMIAAMATDTIDVGANLRIEAGLRYDAVTGKARGAATSVDWGSLLPHVGARARMTDRMAVSLFGGYARSAYSLPLDFLAYGDPAAPVGNVFRWDAVSGTAPLLPTGPLVARVGPGTGGVPAFSRIDPELKRTLADTLTFGVESRPSPAWTLSLAGIVKWEHDPIAVVDTAVATAYETLAVDNPNTLPGQPPTGTVPVYNRLPASFGTDAYLLTNTDVEAPRTFALDFQIAARTRKIDLTFGGTAQRAFTPAASRGFQATENEQGVLGELLVNPNAATFGLRGRPFIDRGYTAKASFIYRLPRDIRLGAIARYQDGQPFAGMIVVPGLNQGTEAVRGFPSGETRFTYTATLDVRVQKGLTLAGARVDALLDVYNLTNHHHEVEERTVLGPGFRTMTAIQPPRAVFIGARVSF